MPAASGSKKASKNAFRRAKKKAQRAVSPVAQISPIAMLITYRRPHLRPATLRVRANLLHQTTRPITMNRRSEPRTFCKLTISRTPMTLTIHCSNSTRVYSKSSASPQPKRRRKTKTSPRFSTTTMTSLRRMRILPRRFPRSSGNKCTKCRSHNPRRRYRSLSSWNGLMSPLQILVC